MVRPTRILVTGAGGFLGSHVVDCASATGFEVVSCCHHAPRRGPGLGTARMDVCDRASVAAVFRAVLPSTVIHCASYGVNYADQDNEQAVAVNVLGSLNVLSAAAEHGARRFVHIGSCFEYGHHDGAISEAAPLNPTAIYGASKAAASILLRERACALGIDLLLLRPFGMWGPREPSFRLVPQVITACLTRRSLKLTACQVIRDYTYVEDMASLVVALALSYTGSGTIVNVGSGRGVLLHDFVLTIARLLDGEELMRFGEIEPRPTEMSSLVADTHRLHTILGTQVTTQLGDGIKRMVASIRAAKVSQ